MRVLWLPKFWDSINQIQKLCKTQFFNHVLAILQGLSPFNLKKKEKLTVFVKALAYRSVSLNIFYATEIQYTCTQTILACDQFSPSTISRQLTFYMAEPHIIRH